MGEDGRAEQFMVGGGLLGRRKDGGGRSQSATGRANLHIDEFWNGLVGDKCADP
jgi:hypothetical protein